MTRLLNIGCGRAFHPAWVNLDTEAVAPEVIAWDIRRGLPFPDGHFVAAYGSHLLEHLEPPAADRLLRELHRVLTPGGLLRLAVPDLEAIVKLYLDSLDRAAAGDASAEWRYDWAMLELIDQTVRTRSGGEMQVFLDGATTDEQKAFIEARVAGEASPAPGRSRRRFLQRCRAAITKMRQVAAGAAAFLFLGAEGRAALHEGLFRRSGEVHRWMYDRYSLGRAVQRAGFVGARACGAGESAIPGFAGYALEIRAGRERKPDSLYLEARKPGSR